MIGSPTTAVLYTSQSLTPAQGAQALANISAGTGALGNLVIDSTAASDNHGITFNAEGVEGGRIFMQSALQKIVVAAHDISLTPSGGALQLGHTSAQDDVVLIQRNGTADAGTTTRSSKVFFFGSSYWDGAENFAALALRNSVDTSGNQTLTLFNDTGNGWPDGITAALRLPNGTSTLPSLQFATAGRGIYYDTVQEQLRIQNNSGQGFLYIGNTTVSGIEGGMFIFSGSGANAGFVGLGVGAITTGFWRNSATDFRFATNSVDCMRLTGTQVNIESGIAFQLGNTAAAGTITADKTLLIKDSTGTSYKIPCVAA